MILSSTRTLLTTRSAAGDTFMPKDKGGIGRTGNKHRKPKLFDKHRKLKQPL